MAFHKDEAGSSLHALHAFTFANAVDRVAGTGYTITAADIGKMAKQTDTNKYYLLVNNSPLTWSEVTAVAGSSGINYISNDSAEDSSSGWSAYADAAAAAPVDGTGGTANVTITRTTSNPLRSNASFLITKDAANRQGQGISYDFTIDRADEAKPLSIEFDYEPLSSFVAGSDSTVSDIVVYIYDLDYSVMIQPAPFKIVGGVGNKHKFLSTFQSNAASGGANSRKYRLILHVATTNASAWTFKFDGVRVGPQTLNYGSPITDWKDETGTGSLVTNTTYTVKSKRIGDAVTFSYNLAFSGSPGTYSNIDLNLPNGYVIDTSKMVSTSNIALGHGIARRNATSSWYFDVLYNSSTSVRLLNYRAGSYVDASAITDTIPSANFINGDNLVATFTVPILGLSSTVEMSNDTSTRIIAARAFASTTSLSSSVSPVVFTSISYDTHSAYNTSNGRFTAPVAGKYKINCVLRFASQSYTSGNLQEVYLSKNGIIYSLMGRNYFETSQTAVAMVSGSDTVDLVAGDYIEIKATNSVTTSLNATDNSYLCVERISGPSQVAASEKINCSVYRLGTQSIPADAITEVVMNNIAFDSHGTFNTSTGRFTCPTAGIYAVNGAVTFDVNSSGARGAYIAKNGVLAKNGGVYAAAPSPVNSIAIVTGLISCVQGDTLSLMAYQNSGGALNVDPLGTSNTVHLNIFKVN